MTDPADKNVTPRVLAFHLPQFHPIKENSEWWGAGFTEWHNVAKARPLFRGHVQPKLPGELGFYDLRLKQTRADQAALARQYGVHGFCYWHYWFDGKRLLEQPLEEILALQEPDFPFCLAWANESWTGIWHGSPRKVLIEQVYSPGDADRHYALLRRFFHDPRYIKHDGRPLLYIYKPRDLPAGGTYLQRLRDLAVADGFPGLFIVGNWTPNPGGQFGSIESLGLDAAAITNMSGRHSHSAAHWINSVARKLFGRLIAFGPQRITYARAMKAMVPVPDVFAFPAYNTVISNWDNTPRSGRRGFVFLGSSPALFRTALMRAFSQLSPKSTPGNYVFLKSWNEWAEGNYVEPDQANGRKYLEAIAEALADFGRI